MHPVEVKWTSELRPAEIKQIMTYPHGVILARQQAEDSIKQIKVRSLIGSLMDEQGG